MSDVAVKPVDLGDGRLVASLADSRPALLSVTFFHPRHGVAELTGMPTFDEHARGNSDEVRAYRRLMASDDFACLWPAGGDDWRQLHSRVRHGALELVWQSHGESLRLRFRGRLDRPALAEITELDPPPPTGAVTTLVADGSRLVVRSTLPASMAIDCSTGEWHLDGEGATLELGNSGEVAVRITSLDNLPAARQRAQASPSTDPIVTRAVAYTRTCAALNTGADEVAILADHRLLPLSWTRDAYYQALLLLATLDPADVDLVADHLRWLWRRCERPGGRWLRSHHANGRPKDLAFQADQQLYPMLELADYRRARSALPEGVDWATEVRTAWNAAMEQLDSDLGLMATAENAADDPVAAPHVAASQVLLWCTAMRLAELAEGEDIGLESGDLRSVADTVRAAFNRHLVVDGRWLYATDGRSRRVQYHDANDLPVALAPLLGFCAADDPGWRATMDFAFSDANPGYFSGERGGLGSAHTPAAWTLGDIQAWTRARITGDRGGMDAATQRLREVAFHDGMLPEAYSTTRAPDVRIRHWFAWPGAAIGALLLLDSRGELERLRAR